MHLYRFDEMRPMLHCHLVAVSGNSERTELPACCVDIADQRVLLVSNDRVSASQNCFGRATSGGGKKRKKMCLSGSCIM